MKLSAILGQEKTVKNNVQKVLTEFFRSLTRVTEYKGYTKSYTPLNNEDTDILPTEEVKVQRTVKEGLKEALDSWTTLSNITLSKDTANCKAKADVVVHDTLIIKDAPITYLLWLEKNLQEILNDIRNLPVLDSDKDWSFDGNTGFWKSVSQHTSRTKKIPFVLSKAKATEHHPEQTEILYEDKKIGDYETVFLSGASSPTHKKELIQRTTNLLNAVQAARETANSITEQEILDTGSISKFLIEGLHLVK